MPVDEDEKMVDRYVRSASTQAIRPTVGRLTTANLFLYPVNTVRRRHNLDKRQISMTEAYNFQRIDWTSGQY